MNALELFLVKASVCLLAFYLPYLLLFNRTTFFAVNRIYLVSSIIFSFVLPFVVLPSPMEFIPTGILEFYEPSPGPSTSIQNHSDPIVKTITLSSVLMAIYFIGVAVHIVRLFLSMQHILKMKLQGETSIVNNIKVVRTKSTDAFSFFNMIFLPRTEVTPLIMEHEKAHIQQYHWVDLVILEITAIILWFNPIMIVYRRSLKLQHEYLADLSVIHKGISLNEYLTCMANQLVPTKALHLTSSFYFQSIKNRIVMLTIKRTSNRMSGLYLIIVPIIACLLFAFSSHTDYQSSSDERDSTIQTKLLFISPIKTSQAKISSEFGERMHPQLRVKKFHTGIDLIAEEGVEVISPEIGVVIESDFDSLHGNFIVIRHDQVYSTSYSHLKMRGAQKGDKVQKGAVIGQVGNTGLSIGPHLHYEVRKNGLPIDPKTYLGDFK